jgi:MFS family permease
MSESAVAEVRADPIRTGLQRSQLFALVATTVAVLIVQLDGRTVPAAIPQIADDLGTSSAALQWVMTGWLLAAAASLIVGGRLADIFGRRLLLLIGTAVLTIGSLVAGLADSVEVLIVGRLLQGTGSAVMYPTALAVITNAFAGANVQRAIGIVLTAGAIGVAIGALLGGILTDTLGWRAVLLLNVPAAILVATFTWRGVTESRDTSVPRSVDWAGVVLIAASLGAVILGVDQAGERGWFDIRTIALLGLGVAGISAFIVVEKRVRFPLLDLSLFRNRTYASVAIAGSLGNSPVAVISFLILVFAQDVQGLSAVEASIAFSTFAIGTAVAAAASGRFGVFPPRVVMVAALIVGGTGTIGMGLSGSGAIFLLFGFASGFGLGLSFAYVNIVSQIAVPARLAGAAAGTAFTVLITGTAIALALAVSIFETITAASLLDDATAISVLFVGCGVASLASALLVATLGRPRSKAADQPT